MAIEITYDVLIFGAGPAGSAAALIAASKGLKTAVIHAGPSPAGDPQPEWLHPDGAKMLADLGIDCRDAVLGAIDRVRFVDAKCKQEARSPIGSKLDVVDSGRLAAAMLGAAKANGAEICTGRVTTIQTHDAGAALITESGHSLAGKVLIAADGCQSLAARHFELERETSSGRRTICCQALAGTVDSKRRAGTRGAGEFTILLASDNLTRFGYTLAIGEALVIGLVAPASDTQALEEFRINVRQWKDAGFIPAAIDPARLSAVVRPVPRGLALDYDTHVGKNTLFIGDAGGYVASASHEGLYPAIWSAGLAVTVCGEALASPHPQDALIEFDARWRREMADYLRPPNSDLRFLLPLIFSNRRMAEKLAQAFFFGTNL